MLHGFRLNRETSVSCLSCSSCRKTNFDAASSLLPRERGALQRFLQRRSVAFDTSATHLYRVGLKLHIENALGYGATPQEILEVMEIASVIGMHTVTVGAPILLELTS